MSDDEVSDYFYSLLRPNESVSGSDLPSSLELLRRAVAGGAMPELVADVFGDWGALILSVCEPSELRVGLPSDEEFLQRLEGVGMYPELRNAVVSDSGSAIVYLLGRNGISGHDWPTWSELRVRAEGLPWRPDLLEQTFGPS
jgi:hypothetical protein